MAERIHRPPAKQRDGAVECRIRILETLTDPLVGRAARFQRWRYAADTRRTPVAQVGGPQKNDPGRRSRSHGGRPWFGGTFSSLRRLALFQRRSASPGVWRTRWQAIQCRICSPKCFSSPLRTTWWARPQTALARPRAFFSIIPPRNATERKGSCQTTADWLNNDAVLCARCWPVFGVTTEVARPSRRGSDSGRDGQSHLEIGTEVIYEVIAVPANGFQVGRKLSC